MGLLKIRPPEWIIKEAVNKLALSKNLTFSEYVNKIENKAHEIYLEEELRAIEEILLAQFKKNSSLDSIVKDLARLISNLSTVIANTRRARGGKSSEYILSYALKYYAGIDNEVIGSKSSRKSYYPDIAIPSKKDLENYPERAIALAVKRTLRERWRGDVSIFFHYPNAAFVCISESTDITKDKLKDMEKEGIKVLFLPDGRFKSLQSFIEKEIENMEVYRLSFLPKWIGNVLLRPS